MIHMHRRSGEHFLHTLFYIFDSNNFFQSGWQKALYILPRSKVLQATTFKKQKQQLPNNDIEQANDKTCKVSDREL